MGEQPTREDIERLLVFLPRLYADGFEPVRRWTGGGPDGERRFTLHWPDYDPLVRAFVEEAGRECWDDPAYEPMDALRMLEDAEVVTRADLAQIRTMLTVIVRGERFGDGHWVDMIEKGYVRRLLERLAEIAGA